MNNLNRKINFFFVFFNTASVLFLFYAFNSCQKEKIGTPGTNEIFLQYKAFNPNQLIIKKGTTITFISKDNSSHTVTSQSIIFDSGTIKSEETFRYTFDSIGNFPFYCKYHATEQSEFGTIVVQ